MANRPLKSNLPADLPDNWTNGNIVAPEGSSVGLTTQHGYNYLMQQVNAAQTAANTINAAFDGLAASNQLPAQNKLVYTLGYSKSGTTHALTGLSGVTGTVSCVFTATAAYAAGDTFTVDGTAYTIQLSNGEEPEDNLFVSGASVPVVVDTAGKKVNFKAAGGQKLPAGTMAIVQVFTENGTFVVPKTGKYKVTVIGKGGDAVRRNNANSFPYAVSGAGAGGVAISILTFQKNESYPVTVSTALSSFGSLLSATCGQNSFPEYPVNVPGLGGTASGGNVYSVSGQSGSTTISSSASGIDSGGLGGAYTSADSKQSPFLSTQPQDTFTATKKSASNYYELAHSDNPKRTSPFMAYGLGGTGESRLIYEDVVVQGTSTYGNSGAVIIEMVLE